MSGPVAPRPAPRTRVVTLNGESDFPGWSATIVVDFPASRLVAIQSGGLADVLAFMEEIIVEHNLPDSEGRHAATLAEVDPWAGLLALLNKAMEDMASVPPPSGRP